MKRTKILLLAMLPLMALGFAGCNDDDDNYYTEPASSYLFTIAPEDWYEYEDEFGVIGFETEFEIPALTQQINDAGAVLVYFDFQGEGVFNALPHVYDDITYLFNTYPGSLQMQILGAGVGVEPAAPGAIDCKVVLISGAWLEAKKGEVNFNDLKAVEKAFNLR